MEDQKTFSLVSVKNLIDKNTLLHLRLPFSFFLLPVFLFAFATVTSVNIFNAVLIFIILHFLIYPSSNAYNSYMDRDTGSIGVLENPPPVTKRLFYASVLLDSSALFVSCIINIRLALMICLYIAVSKAYSWNKTRLKKHGIISWITVSFFQGGFTFLMVKMCLENNFNFFPGKETWYGIIAASLLIGSIYPISQIYQHNEDRERGDVTISSRLGIKGTFIFSGLSFLAGLSFLLIFFYDVSNYLNFYLMLAFLFPIVVFYAIWFYKSWLNPAKADFKNTMRFIFAASLCLSLYFLALAFLKTSF